MQTEREGEKREGMMQLCGYIKNTQMVVKRKLFRKKPLFEEDAKIS